MISLRNVFVIKESPQFVSSPPEQLKVGDLIDVCFGPRPEETKLKVGKIVSVSGQKIEIVLDAQYDGDRSTLKWDLKSGFYDRLPDGYGDEGSAWGIRKST